MTKKRFGAIAGVLMMLFSSCIGGSRAAMLSRENGIDKAEARLEHIVDAINNKDRDAIKAVFSQQALADAEDIDKGIDYLFATFPNGIDSWEKSSGNEKESRNHGIRKARSNNIFNIYAGEMHYVFSIIEHTVDTEHPEKLGVNSIIAWDEKEEVPSFPYPKAGIYAPEEFLNDSTNSE